MFSRQPFSFYKLWTCISWIFSMEPSEFWYSSVTIFFFSTISSIATCPVRIASLIAFFSCPKVNNSSSSEVTLTSNQLICQSEHLLIRSPAQTLAVSTSLNMSIRSLSSLWFWVNLALIQVTSSPTFILLARALSQRQMMTLLDPILSCRSSTSMSQNNRLMRSLIFLQISISFLFLLHSLNCSFMLLRSCTILNSRFYSPVRVQFFCFMASHRVDSCRFNSSRLWQQVSLSVSALPGGYSNPSILLCSWYFNLMMSESCPLMLLKVQSDFRQRAQVPLQSHSVYRKVARHCKKSSLAQRMPLLQLCSYQLRFLMFSQATMYFLNQRAISLAPLGLTACCLTQVWWLRTQLTECWESEEDKLRRYCWMCVDWLRG